MTNFTADPRVRDAEEHAVNTTGLGPNFSGSLNDLWKMVFRPSDAFLRYVKLAVSNDDGSKIAGALEDALAAFSDAAVAELQKISAAVEKDGGQLIQPNPDKVFPVGGKTVRIGPLGIPGVTAVLYTANDAFGTQQRVEVPKSGIIQSIRFYDLDDEGLNMEVLLFNKQPAAEVDNDAISISDAELATIEASILIDTWRDLIDNQVGVEDNLGIAYTAPDGVLWAQWVTRGGPTIAAGSLPRWSITIQADE